MEVSRLPSSAFRFSDVRSRQVIANSRHKIKHLGVSNYPSSKCSQTLPPSSNAFPFPKSCSKLSINGAPWPLKAVPVQLSQAQEQQQEAKPALAKEGVWWRFLRPFPMYAGFIQYSAVVARRLVENPHLLQFSNWSMILKIFVAFASIACSMFFTSGINQIFDVEIDRINKPDLPLTSGEISIESAWVMMISFVAIGLLIAGLLNSVPFVFWNFCVMLVGAVYSMPPFRTKISTIGAPITIGLMQGFVHFFALYAGAGAALGLPFQPSLPMVYLSIFTTVFSIVMGVLKDISDIEGDSKNNIPTVATIIGIRKTLIIGVGIHIHTHLGMVLAAIFRPELFKRSIMVPSHILSILFLLYQAWKIHQINYESTQTRKLYMSMWRTYFAQFLLLPFM